MSSLSDHSNLGEDSEEDYPKNTSSKMVDSSDEGIPSESGDLSSNEFDSENSDENE